MTDMTERLPILMAIGGLILKRKEIAASIERQQYELRKLITELNALDKTAEAALSSHAQDFLQRTAVVPPRAFCGQQRLILLMLLAESAGPLTTRQLALGLMLHRGLPTTDLKLVRQMIQRVHLTLHAMKRKQEVGRQKDGDLFRWFIPVDPGAGDAA